MHKNKDSRRYIRHIVLQDMGEEGQEKLARAKVLVAGAGGLGCPAALYLAAAGVGTLGIADHDVVEISNLNRQILFEQGDVGRTKVESALDALGDLNPTITLNGHALRIDEDNAPSLVQGYDIILDGTDSIETRFLLHRVCYAQKKPYISAAVLGWEGQLAIFQGYEPALPCYQCLYAAQPPADAVPNCAENGIIGAAAGVIGSWQAAEAIKLITGAGSTLAGYLLRLNLLSSEVKRVQLPKDPNCTLCTK